MTTKVDPEAMRDVKCPLCGHEGTLRYITPKQRLRIGYLSMLMNWGKTHECTRCGVKV